jgi:uncharacterized protein (DUF433 family)
MIKWQDHIVSDPKIMVGKPCFKGTRIPVYLVLQKIALGEPAEEILEGYPALSKDSLQAAQLFAVDVINSEVVYPAVP